MVNVPRSHPRYVSLMIRERLVEAFKEGIVVPEGLMAHGRGEAFDYILGEVTHEMARKAVRAAAALLLISEKPVISVNGNSAALVGRELVELAREVKAPLEVNLFYWSRSRVEKIGELLKSYGANEVLLPIDDAEEVPGLESSRRLVNRRGIYRADTVFVAMEDGDRTEKLRRLGKHVVAVDLNPFSRTARAATVTIVDNVVRALPELTGAVREMRSAGREKIREVFESFDNERNLKEFIATITQRLDRLASYGEPLSD
ncbi:MAG: phosphopantothenate/pantothenate synthetase [Thaumarchaeota archaeon]|nr:phosphopantothenate/pantothenate synthetase [Candidatus Calditenuaceae archaeon]MDW8186594.1 phosphopantothenate/pantothenate synthetase [Nitrososphaerota archaeon]